MKALVYERAHELSGFALALADVAEPVLRERDVLVDVRAIGINPGEALIRRSRSAEPGGRVLLGWEFAGTVVAVGPAVEGFAPGDRVLGTGDITRDGAWAERVAVDHRLLAHLPDRIRPITTTRLDGLTVDTMRAAHEIVESGHGLGKTVIVP